MLRLRPRFSLLTVILLLTIVGLSIVVVQLWREVAPLQAEVRLLRDQMGQLSVADVDFPNAMRIRMDEPNTWRWRVYLPPLPFDKYHVNCYCGLHSQITAQNVHEVLDKFRRAGPNWRVRVRDEISLERELTIEAKFVSSEGHWRLQLLPLGDVPLALPSVGLKAELGMESRSASLQDWLNLKDKSQELNGLNQDRQRVFGWGESMLLLCLQGEPVQLPGAWAKGSAPNPVSDTLLLWIDSGQR